VPWESSESGKNWQIDYLEPTRKRIRKSFEKRKEAEAELAKRVALIAEGRYLDVKVEYTTTMGELLDKYEENYNTQKSFHTWKYYCLQNFREYFGDGPSCRAFDTFTWRRTVTFSGRAPRRAAPFEPMRASTVRCPAFTTSSPRQWSGK